MLILVHVQNVVFKSSFNHCFQLTKQFFWNFISYCKYKQIYISSSKLDDSQEKSQKKFGSVWLTLFKWNWKSKSRSI